MKKLLLTLFVLSVMFLSAVFCFSAITDEDSIDFRIGDANLDQSLNVADANFLLNYLSDEFAPAPGCPNIADWDGNGAIDISDPIGILNYLFSAGPQYRVDSIHISGQYPPDPFSFVTRCPLGAGDFD